MNKEHRSILYGMVLGDGNLYRTKNNYGVDYCKLTIGHSPRQREYLEHKINLLHSIFGGKKPKIYSYESRGYTNLQTVKTNTYFKQMRRKLYPDGNKTYTKEVLDYLTPHGIALWYLDDGSGTVYGKNGKISGCMTRIATYCSLEEVEILKTWFKKNYDLNCVFDLDKRNRKYSIRFNTSDSHKFIDMISKYVPNCMRYKIEHVEKYNPRKPSSLKKDEDIV